MMEKQIVTDPKIAANIQNRLIDPRDIEAIILTTTQDEPTIKGFTQPQVAFAAWADTNKTCDSILKNLPFSDVSVHIGPGSGTEGRTAVSSALIDSLIERRSSDKPKILAFIQLAGIPQFQPTQVGRGSSN